MEDRPKSENLAERARIAFGSILACALAVHAIAVAYIGQYVPPEFIRSGALFACAVVVALTSPLATNLKLKAPGPIALAWAVDALLLANLGYACWNFLQKIEDVENLIVFYSTLDTVSALIALLTLLELTRRVFGFVLALFALATLLYCLFGANLPWIFRHSGFSLEQTVEIIWFGFQGVFGFPTGIVILLVFIFVVFGSLLEGSGAGNVMIRLALFATARTRGGPAHSAIIASSIFGMSSGSVTANVVGTGTMTIPLIKRRGFPGSFAGGVEAAGSTGGQLMPPVMGAAAFLMSQLAGVSYQTICIAALIPALLYYGSLFVSVAYESRRLGLEPIHPDAIVRPEKGDGLKSLMFFVPLAAIIVTLWMGRSPAMAGFWAAATTIGTGLLLNPELRRNPGRLFTALAKGGVAGAHIMMAVAAIGLMIGVFDLTGIGLKFAGQVAALGAESLMPTLILAALACLILGLGMPTLPAYLVIVLVLGATLTKTGLPVLSVHLFVFYFGVLSAITPPVALAAVAAAPIAGAEPFRTGIAALRLSLIGFVVPFVFVYEPTLLLVVVEFEPWSFASILVRLLLAIWLIATAFSGYDTEALPPTSRVLRLIAAFLTLIVLAPFQLAGLSLAAIIVAHDRMQARKTIRNNKSSPNTGANQTIKGGSK